MPLFKMLIYSNDPSGTPSRKFTPRFGRVRKLFSLYVIRKIQAEIYKVYCIQIGVCVQDGSSEISTQCGPDCCCF